MTFQKLLYEEQKTSDKLSVFRMTFLEMMNNAKEGTMDITL